MKINYTACAICDSNWGNLWDVVEGERLFFCCDICLVQFRNLVERIKAETGWNSIDTLTIAGDRTGRSCRATRGADSFDCAFSFNSLGALRTFDLAPRAAAG